MILGRKKLELAPPLHNKVLYADADMNKADWMTSAAATVGVAGIGLGWWWADAAAAIVIATSILRDGITNLRAAVAGLIDARPTSVDNKDPHPLLGEIDAYLRSLDWVHTAGARVRDEGQVFHVEGFVVPRPLEVATPERLEAARAGLLDLDWKVRDAVVATVPQLPHVLETHSPASESPTPTTSPRVTPPIGPGTPAPVTISQLAVQAGDGVFWAIGPAVGRDIPRCAGGC